MKTRLSWLEVILLAAPFLALASYWNDLPARVPVHWDLSGQINGGGNEIFVRTSGGSISLNTAR